MLLSLAELFLVLSWTWPDFNNGLSLSSHDWDGQLRGCYV